MLRNANYFLHLQQKVWVLATADVPRNVPSTTCHHRFRSSSMLAPFLAFMQTAYPVLFKLVCRIAVPSPSPASASSPTAESQPDEHSQHHDREAGNKDLSTPMGPHGIAERAIEVFPVHHRAGLRVCGMSGGGICRARFALMNRWSG